MSHPQDQLQARIAGLEAAQLVSRHRIRRLTATNIVLAVTVLGFGGAGAAYAALAAPNSVNSAAIIDRTIGTPDVKVGAFGGQTILDNSMTSLDIQDNGIRSIDVADGTLLARDFAAGSSEYTFLSAVSDSNSDSPKEVLVDCPAGTYVVGSYHDIAGGKTGSAPDQYASVVVDKSLPTGTNGILSAKPTRVYLQAFESYATASNWSLRVGVTCAKMS